MAYKAIIFDLDGTLVESVSGIAAGLNLALLQHQLPTYSESEVRHFIGDGSRMLCRRAAPELSEEEIDTLDNTFQQCYETTWRDGTVIYNDVISLLQQCQKQNIRMAVLSNKPHNFTVDIIKGMFADFEFDLVMGQQANITKKPAPEGTLLCLAKLNTAAEDCLFIGDSDIDIQTAIAAGTPSAGVTWGYHPRERIEAAGPTHIATTMAELSQIILH